MVTANQFCYSKTFERAQYQEAFDSAQLSLDITERYRKDIATRVLCTQKYERPILLEREAPVKLDIETPASAFQFHARTWRSKILN